MLNKTIMVVAVAIVSCVVTWLCYCDYVMRCHDYRCRTWLVQLRWLVADTGAL